ncbi:hypothetical protein E3N88_39766 [Mikania micrantha]|uniref:Uncharacterized protein n=1 Tax=Mikania micrantha TaxID=192012 RepID=A0A5N6LKR0_9ASTR|nr:hypothetical protein E3N88_39766 [Mikania micrantha]
MKQTPDKTTPALQFPTLQLQASSFNRKKERRPEVVTGDRMITKERRGFTRMKEDLARKKEASGTARMKESSRKGCVFFKFSRLARLTQESFNKKVSKLASKQISKSIARFSESPLDRKQDRSMHFGLRSLSVVTCHCHFLGYCPRAADKVKLYLPS